MSPEDEADATLAGRAADGDQAAFGLLVRRHKDGLYRLLRHYLGDPDDAYEAVQEAFVAAWRAIGRYDPKRPFLAWLRTIAINKARDKGRRAAFRRLIFGSSGLEHGEAANRADASPGPEASLLEREQLAMLDRAVARLPAKLKESLLLTAFEGCSQQEAGEVLGVSAKTVETRVYRARKLLIQSMRPTADDRSTNTE